MTRFQYSNNSVLDLLVNSLNANDVLQKEVERGEVTLDMGNEDGDLILRLNDKRFRIHIEGD